MKKPRFRLCCILLSLLTFPLFSEDVSVDPSLYFDDPRPFYTDASGYHGFGVSLQEDSEEALRLAKADALKRIFSGIGKDELFQEICIAAWPESIRQEEFSVRKNAAGMFTAAVRILIDRSAVALTDQRYSESAAILLDRSETLNGRIQELMFSAQKAEEAVLIQEALTLYRQAKAGCGEVRTLLRKLTDNSVISLTGLNRSSILQITASMEQSADQGLGRIALAEKTLKMSGLAAETDETLRLLDIELDDLSATVRLFLEQSPFYDLPKQRLTAIEADLVNLETKAGVIRGKLELIKSQTVDGRTVTLDKIALSLSDLGTLDIHLDNMKKEVEEEIRYPRLARQEDAFRRMQFRRKLSSTAAWMFLHDPNDFFRVQWDLPFGYLQEKGWAGIGDSELILTAEGGFKAGFWFQTSLTIAASANSALPAYSSLQEYSQTVSLGVFRNSLFGLGYGWDWSRKVAGPKTQVELKPVSKVILYFGSLDRDRLRPSLLVSVGYAIPAYLGEFILPYHLNADIDISLRLENILILDAGISSECLDFNSPEVPDFEPGNLHYSVGWKAGAALRFPGPFAWGIRYSGGAGAKLEKGMPAALEATAGAWRGYVQYSF